MTNENEMQTIIKSILNVRCREGATITEIRNDYEEMTGQPLLDVYDCLSSIECAYYVERPKSEPQWFVKSDHMQHLTKLIMEQKPPQPRHYQAKPFQAKPIRPQNKLNHSIKENDCFFKDNIVYKHMRKQKQCTPQRNKDDINNNTIGLKSYQPKLIETPPKPAKITLDAQFVGDDFFRTLACDSTSQGLDRKNGVQYAGLCVSGLSIQAAAKLIEISPTFKSKRLIINTGSVDILHGHDLVEMCTDFEKLIKVCEGRGLQPIITTLAPLANIGHSLEMVKKLREFNVFLIEKYFSAYTVIDIWSKMTNPRGLTYFDYYQPEPNYVSGSNRPHVLWNQHGRKMIRDYIHRYIKTALQKSNLHIDA